MLLICMHVRRTKKKKNLNKKKKTLGSLKKQLCFSSETMVKLNKVKPTDFAHQKISFRACSPAKGKLLQAV